MSGIINDFSLISKLSDEFKQNICLFYIFENASLNSNTKVIKWKGYNAFIKTSDDKVFGYGENSFGQLGLGHANPVINPKQILELCGYDIVEISNGLTHCVARNIYGQLFEWGKNDIGITKDKFYNEPEIVSALAVENVISICCGYSHTIALTKSGNVYAWGSNKWGQLGINDKKSSSTPLKVQGFNEDHVKSIACGSWHSMALTKKGNVYGWGLNRYGQLGNGNKKDSRSILQIKILNSNSKPALFKKISCGKDHSLLLTNDGDVYVCGYNHTFGNIFKNETIIKLESKFIDIGAHHFYDISSALKYDGYYEIWGKWNEKDIFPKETKFETLVDIFKYYFVITYRAINPKNFDSIPKRINGKYKEEFIEQSLISSAGGFGEVFNAMNKIDSQIYAIKKIALDENQFDMIFRELNIMHSLNSDYVVKYYNSWMENNYYNIRDSTINYNQKLSNPLKPFLLHIQMEFCIMTLRQFIDDLKDLLQRLPNEATAYKYIYYTSVLLFIEVVESVNYLHKLKPPIIHRDLKPDNILVTCGKIGRPGTVVMVKYHEKDHRFIRIADFGLSVRHEFVGQSHTADQGTVKYAAPEVIYGRDYDTKADIYSLGVIIENLFDYENEM